LAAQLAAGGDDSDTTGGDVFARISSDNKAVLARALGDMQRLTHASSVQARCLECAGLGPVAAPETGDMTLLDMLVAKFAGKFGA
jgi:protease-4